MVCVLQESGDLHVVDAANGNIAHEYVAKVKINSNWACDRENQRLLVVGDVGQACVLDMTISTQTAQNKLRGPADSQLSRLSYLTSKLGDTINQAITKKVVQWPQVRSWFTMHTIAKLDDAFVVSVKFA